MTAERKEQFDAIAEAITALTDVAEYCGLFAANAPAYRKNILGIVDRLNNIRILTAPKPQAVAEDALVEALRKLDELDAKRTKGPWSQDQTAIHDEDMRAVRIADCSELRMRTERWSHTVASYEQCTINAAFIVALENAWPILRAALKSTAQG